MAALGGCLSMCGLGRWWLCSSLVLDQWMGTARESQGPHEARSQNKMRRAGSHPLLQAQSCKTKCDSPAATVCCRPSVANPKIALLKDVLVALLACVGSHTRGPSRGWWSFSKGIAVAHQGMCSWARSSNSNGQPTCRGRRVAPKLVGARCVARGWFI